MLGALLLAAGGYFSTLDIGAYSELRLRLAPSVTLEGVQAGPIAAVDFVTTPYVRLESKSRHSDLKFSYAANITLPDLETLATTPQDPQLFQMADLSAWYSTRHWVLGFSQGGSIGEMNFSYLTPYAVTPGQPVGGPPPVQLIPCSDATHCANENVVFGSSATTATIRYLHRNDTWGLVPSYTVSGGIDAPSRALVPVLSMPRVDFGVEHRVTRRDELLTQGDLTGADSTQRACNPATGGPPVNIFDPNPPLCAPNAQWVSLREMWRHHIGRRVATELIAGATIARVTVNDTEDLAHENPAQPHRIVPYPVFGAVVSYLLQNPDPDRPALNPPMQRDPPKPSAYVYSRVGPVVDTHFGIVDPRLEIGAAILKPIDEKYLFHARAAFVRSLWGTSLDATYLAGEVSGYRRLDKYRFDVGTGIRGAWQHDPFSGEFWVFSAFLSFTWHEPRLVL